MYVLQLLDWYAASISIILICFLELLCICWMYGVENFIRDIEFMLNVKLHCWWRLCWKFITPVILMVSMVALVFRKLLILYFFLVYFHNVHFI